MCNNKPAAVREFVPLPVTWPCAPVSWQFRPGFRPCNEDRCVWKKSIPPLSRMWERRSNQNKKQTKSNTGNVYCTGLYMPCTWRATCTGTLQNCHCMTRLGFIRALPDNCTCTRLGQGQWRKKYSGSPGTYQNTLPLSEGSCAHTCKFLHVGQFNLSRNWSKTVFLTPGRCWPTTHKTHKMIVRGLHSHATPHNPHILLISLSIRTCIIKNKQFSLCFGSVRTINFLTLTALRPSTLKQSNRRKISFKPKKSSRPCMDWTSGLV